MAPKTGPSLKELMRNRNKAPSLKDKNKSKPPTNPPPPPPPPQIPVDLGLKLLKKESWALPKEVSSSGSHKTIGTEGLVLWITERNLRWPKYIGLHVLGHLCWR